MRPGEEEAIQHVRDAIGRGGPVSPADGGTLIGLIERYEAEGVPGRIHDVDRAFYDLAVKERNYERVRYDRVEQERNEAREERNQARADLARLRDRLGSQLL